MDEKGPFRETRAIEPVQDSRNIVPMFRQMVRRVVRGNASSPIADETASRNPSRIAGWIGRGDRIEPATPGPEPAHKEFHGVTSGTTSPRHMAEELAVHDFGLEADEVKA